MSGLVDIMKKTVGSLEPMRVQIAHTGNLEGALELKDKVMAAFKCDWIHLGQISFVLGAHTGPSMVGLAFAPNKVFEGLE